MFGRLNSNRVRFLSEEITDIIENSDSSSKTLTSEHYKASNRLSVYDKRRN